MKIRIETIHEIPDLGIPSIGVTPADTRPPITWAELLRRGRIEIEGIQKTRFGEVRATTVYEIIEG